MAADREELARELDEFRGDRGHLIRLDPLGRRRERLKRRQEKREEWAGARSRDAEAARERVHAIADRIPFGQPILVGHHSERGHRRDIARIEAGMSSAVENWRQAERHEAAAEGIGEQLARSIYSDDVDAVERLQAKVAALEGRRDRVKAFNKAVRARGVGPAEAGQLAEELLTEREREELRGLYRINFAGGRTGLEFPGYVLTNLGAEIRRCRQRLEQLRKAQTTIARGDRGRGRPMSARFSSRCAECGKVIEKGSAIVYYRLVREAVHEGCADAG